MLQVNCLVIKNLLYGFSFAGGALSGRTRLCGLGDKTRRGFLFASESRFPNTLSDIAAPFSSLASPPQSPTISYSKPSPPTKPIRRKLSIPQQQQDYAALTGPQSPSDQDRPPSSAFLNRLAESMRDKRSLLEVRKEEFMSETLPEWKVKSAELSSIAKETGMEWGKRGRDTIDRWKKDRMSDTIPATSPSYLSTFPSFSASEPSSPRESIDELHIFGCSLESAVDMTRLSENDHVPGIIRRCIEYLDEYGIDEVGIYRISGGATTVNKLRTIFDSASDVDFRGTNEDPHAVSALLKMYLRQLPEPIIPAPLAREMHEAINQTTQAQNDSLNPAADAPIVSPNCIKAIALITQKLPPSNFHVLKCLCWHLNRIANNDQVNRMNTSNLGLIFIPTLGIGRVMFHCFVEHADQIWGPSSPRIPTKKQPPVLPRRPTQNINKSMIGRPQPLDTVNMPPQWTDITSAEPSKPSIPNKKNDKEIAELREKFERDFGPSINSGARKMKTPPEKPQRSPRPDSPGGVYNSMDSAIRGNSDLRPFLSGTFRTSSPSNMNDRENSSPVGRSPQRSPSVGSSMTGDNSPTNGKAALDYFKTSPKSVNSVHLRQKSANQASVRQFSDPNTKPRSKSVSATEAERPARSSKGGRVMAMGSYFENRQ